MKTPLLSFLALAAGFSLVAGTSTLRASEPNHAPDVTGRWFGFLNDQHNSDSRPKEVQLGIDEQEGRKFAGNLHLGPVPTTDPFELLFPIHGRLSSHSTAWFAGRTDEGRLYGRGRIIDVGGGGAVFEGGLRARLANGTNHGGTLLLLRPFEPRPILAPEFDVNGVYEGRATSAVSGVERKLAATLRGDGRHAEVLLRSEDGDFTFPLGHWTSGGDRQVLLIAQGAKAYIIMSGTLRPAIAVGGGLAIHGRYKVARIGGRDDNGFFDIQRVRPLSE